MNNKESILVLIHPFWTNHTRNKHYIDSVINYSKEFNYTLILLPRIPKGIKRKLLRSTLRKITTNQQTVNGVLLVPIRKFFNYPDKLFGIHGCNTRYNTNSTYRTRLKRLKVLSRVLLSKRIPIFKSEPIIDASYFQSYDYLKTNITDTTSILEHGYNSPFIASNFPDHFNYTLIGEYANQCVSQVYDILTEKDITVSIHHPLTVCNQRADYDQSKLYYAYDKDRPTLNLKGIEL